MDRNDFFLRNNSFLKLDINHLDYGRFPLGLHHHDILPHNRLYIIHPSSSGTNDFIRQRGWKHEKMALNPGRIYFIPSGFDLEYKFSRRLLFAGVHFDLELFPGMDLFFGETRLRKKNDTRDWSRLFWDCLDDSASLSNMTSLRGIILSMAGLFVDKNEEELKIMMKREERFGAIFQWLRKNIRAGIQIQDVAELAGCSREALSKSFSRHMGCSLKDYISRELTREAVRRISFSDRKIRDIARELNFNDEYYFSRFFAKHTGYPPGEYRKRFSEKSSE